MFDKLITLLTPPPQPPWEGLHPLVIHLPIGLLLVAPLFVLVAALLPKWGRWAGWSALILLVLGTGSAYVAVQTGEAARDMVEDGPDEMWPVLEEHEARAENAFNVFAALTIVYAVLRILPLVWRKAAQDSIHVPLNLIFLVLLLTGNLLLANAAHQGGLLVHQFGVRSPLGAESAEGASGDAEGAGADSESPAEDAAATESMSGDEASAPQAAAKPGAADPAATEPPPGPPNPGP